MSVDASDWCKDGKLEGADMMRAINLYHWEDPNAILHRFPFETVATWEKLEETLNVFPGSKGYLVLYSEEGAIIPRSIWPHFLKHGVTYAYSYKRIVSVCVEPVVGSWNGPCKTRSQYPEDLSVFQLRRELFEEMRRQIGIVVPDTSQHLGLQVKSGPVLNDKFLVRDYLIDGHLSLELNYYDTRIDEALNDFNDFSFDNLSNKENQIISNHTPDTTRSSVHDDGQGDRYEYFVPTSNNVSQHSLPGGAGEPSTNYNPGSAGDDGDSRKEGNELWESMSALNPHQSWGDPWRMSGERTYLGRANSWDSGPTELSFENISAKLHKEPPPRPAPLDSLSTCYTDQVREWYQTPSRKEELENRAASYQAEIAESDKHRQNGDRTPITQQFAQYNPVDPISQWGLPTPSTAMSWQSPQAPRAAESWNQQQPATPKTAVPWRKPQNHDFRRPSHPVYNSQMHNSQMHDAGRESWEWPQYPVPRPPSAQIAEEMRNDFVRSRPGDVMVEMDMVVDEDGMNKF